MRIISGSHRGRRIIVPKNLPIRPTTDRSKEGLFNILHHSVKINSISVLDLFSGAGNISYEFASRGAQRITSVDQNRFCVKFIQKTIQELGFNISVIKAESLSFLEKNKIKYDLIFADPPYNWNEIFYKKLVLLSQKSLNDNGIVILEHNKFLNSSSFEGFDFSRAYGDSLFSFFK